MLSTICTVNRSIPTSRLRALWRLMFCLFFVYLAPSVLHAASPVAMKSPTEASSIYASKFIYAPINFPDTSTTAVQDENRVITTDFDAREPGPATGSATAGAGSQVGSETDAGSATDTYREERSGTAGFSRLATFLDGIDRVPAVEPPWPDFGRFDVPISYNDWVKRAIHVLRNDASGIYAGWLSRTNRYRAMIQSIFARSGLPEDLVHVAMVESGFDPRARSLEGRAGLWQLTLKDADRYGLARSEEVDERYDPEKSTRAAAARFKDLYLELGNWDLVMAAHHAGSEPVRSAEGLSLWSMQLPDRTIPFVAFVMASTVIAKTPEEYGFEPLGGLPLMHETVPVQRAMVLEEVAEGMKIQVERLRELNPELRRWKAVPGFDLNVPLGTKRTYTTWAGIEPAGPDPSDMAYYRVRRGDTLGRIASRFGVSTRDIVVENSIRRPNRLRIGQVLTIPLYGSSIRSSNRSIANRRPRDVPPPDPATHQAISYRIRRGDTLERIARRYGVSMANLQDWNKLNNPGDIIAGRSLTIYIPRPRGAATGNASSSTGTSGAVAGTNPAASVASAPGAIVYTVKRGDTLWDIARTHKVTVSALRRTNGLSRRSAIHPGDRLRIDPSDS